jgi:ribosomal protein S3
MYYLRKLIKLLFSNGFCDKNKIKGLKIVFKGRINGSRRKMKYIIEYGQTSVQHFKDKVSYHQEHCYTLFGVSGIKVWIISR